MAGRERWVGLDDQNELDRGRAKAHFIRQRGKALKWGR